MAKVNPKVEVTGNGNGSKAPDGRRFQIIGAVEITG